MTQCLLLTNNGSTDKLHSSPKTEIPDAVTDSCLFTAACSTDYTFMSYNAKLHLSHPGLCYLTGMQHKLYISTIGSNRTAMPGPSLRWSRQWRCPTLYLVITLMVSIAMLQHIFIQLRLAVTVIHALRAAGNVICSLMHCSSALLRLI